VVKLGIICEGETEPIILDTIEFKAFVAQYGIDLIAVTQAGGKREYEADRIDKHRQILIDRGAEHIIVLIDLDTDACITLTKQRINQTLNQTVIVAVKEFENWYLADSQALSNFLGIETKIEYPEQDDDAITTMIDMGITAKAFARYRKSKVLLARDMHRHGFTIENAAKHPNCPSAQYFLTKLQTLASAN
jgi:ribosomal protein L5